MSRTATGRGVGALYSIEFPCMHSVNDALHKLHQVGGRGLLGHHPASIPLVVIVRGSVGVGHTLCP
jgi:hypothetical protein